MARADARRASDERSAWSEFLLDEIEEAQKRTKIPFIYVTHNEKEAERLEKNRITIKNGRILSQNRER